MPYYSGTAASLTELRDKVVAHCVGNGWTWDATEQVIYKSGTFIRLALYNANTLQVNGRTSLTGTNSTQAAYVSAAYPTSLAMTFPVNYETFIIGDEVYTVINFNTAYFKWLVFGTSNLAAKLPGTGAFFAASDHSYSLSNYTAMGFASDGSTSGNYSGAAVNTPCPFWSTGPSGICAFSAGFTALPVSQHMEAALLSVLPNTWNNETILLPVRLWGAVAGAYHREFRIAAELQHLRYTRNTYYANGEIVDVGGVAWKIYPALCKDMSTTNGVGGAIHSGTIALAVRYEGP